MTPVLLSNPGLPLAVYGNPGKRRKSKSRRKSNPRNKRRRSTSRRKNPVYLGSKAGMWATNPGLKRKLAKKFPGWKVTSIKVVKRKARKARKSSKARKAKSSSRRRTSSRRRARAVRRNPRKATMARTKSRRRRSNPTRSKRTGRFLSHRTKKFQGRRARRTVGRTYRRKGRTVVVTRAHVRRRAGRRVKNAAVKWSGKRGKISYRGYGYRKGRKGRRVVRFTNPKSRRSRRARRNPAMASSYIRGLTSAPSNVVGLFKGGNTVKKVAFTAGGAIGAYVAGGVVSRFVSPFLANVPGMSNPMIQRVVGAAFPYTIAFAAAKFVDLGKMKNHVLVGGALASILELLVPGQVASWIQRIPGLSAIPGVQGLAGLGGLSGPSDMLAGYVQAPSYAGVGQEMLAGYVQAPSYAGVGNGEALAGYVQAPSYAGVGNADYLETDNYLKSSYLNG